MRKKPVMLPRRPRVIRLSARCEPDGTRDEMSSMALRSERRRCSKTVFAQVLNSPKEPMLASITESIASRSSGLKQVAVSASKERSAPMERSSERLRASVPWPQTSGMTEMRSSCAPLVIFWKVKSSITHQSREGHVGPARTTSLAQPARKMGRQARLSASLSWSMQARSNQTRGGRPDSFSKSLAQRQRASHFAVGESCHECERKASHIPSSALCEWPCTSLGRERSKSDARSLSKETTRKFSSAEGSSCEVESLACEQSPATTAALRSSAVEPSRATHARAAPRARGVVTADQRRAQTE
mmetsp:Transcript_48503/g.157204  ORF Transcript_48503/g.157204 Transcript_48503/m.157204 type:complete len:301 (+) Transcript_48503:281-1183(+)